MSCRLPAKRSRANGPGVDVLTIYTERLALREYMHDQDGQLIGNCGVRLDHRARREGNIGYELNPEYWARGYATEAAWAMLSYGFDHLRLHRFWAQLNADNLASAHVLEKIGMRRRTKANQPIRKGRQECAAYPRATRPAGSRMSSPATHHAHGDHHNKGAYRACVWSAMSRLLSPSGTAPAPTRGKADATPAGNQLRVPG
jgi:hypothetical protein